MKTKSIVRLRKKKLTNGNQSLYLDIWHDGKRTYEFLKLYVVAAKAPAHRNANKENLLLAESIRAKKQIFLKNKQYGFQMEYQMEMNFIDYFKKLTDEKLIANQNYGNWDSTYKHIVNYAGVVVLFKDVDLDFVKGFKEHMQYKAKSKSNNLLFRNTQHSYYNKFRCALRKAHRDGLIPHNPATAIEGVSSETTYREYLAINEVRKLVQTDCKYEVLKKAFLFCCLTGLRCSDANKMVWKDVHEEEHCYRVKFRQQKTGGMEYLDINDQAYALMGEQGLMDERVFVGLRYSAYHNLELKRWVMNAGIQKDITFHCSRHNFAVMQLEMGTEIYTVSKLLGHTHLKTTEVYAKIVDSKKREAMMNIPLINL